MMRSLLAAAMLLSLAGPAAAHKLRVFATVEGAAIVGYAFFVGGGRAKDTPWIATTADGEIGAGRTDAEGKFRLVPSRPVTSDIAITVDTREGHIASATVAAARLGGGAVEPEPAPTAPVDAAARLEGAAPGAEAIAALVDASVERQLRPLFERIEEMDSRLRLTDALSGVFLIFGVAGIVLWVRGRRL